MRVAFLYLTQDHQIPHSLPIACELSRMADVDVTVFARTQEHLELARRLSLLYPENRLGFELLRALPRIRFKGTGKWAKRVALLGNRRRLNSFDALVATERTSIQLRWLGVRRPRFIHSFHGSSGHDRVTDRRLRRFDLLLAPSARRLERIVAVNAVQAGRATVIGYSKLDLVRRMNQPRARLFRNERPTVLYNPHHWAHKSSWHTVGHEVLRMFREQCDFNLIFAPHMRLFDPPERFAAGFRKYATCEHLLIDLGSQSSIDMTYTLAADIYLGDVSSQVFEFVIRPRPCLFLNPRGLEWEHDENFASWWLGQVITQVSDIPRALQTIGQWQPQYEALQRQSVIRNFPEHCMPAPMRGAQAIAAFLRDGELRSGWDEEGHAEVPVFRRAQDTA